MLVGQSLGGLNVPGLSKVLEDAIAVIFGTGSGDRLTSRCCREITLAVLLFISTRDWLKSAANSAAMATFGRKRLHCSFGLTPKRDQSGETQKAWTADFDPKGMVSPAGL